MKKKFLHFLYQGIMLSRTLIKLISWYFLTSSADYMTAVCLHNSKIMAVPSSFMLRLVSCFAASSSSLFHSNFCFFVASPICQLFVYKVKYFRQVFENTVPSSLMLRLLSCFPAPSSSLFHGNCYFF